MSKRVAIQTPDGDARALAIPGASEETGSQVGMLLAITTQLMPFTIRANDVIADAKLELDGGVKCAAEAAVIAACGRLQQIIEEPGRWTVEAEREHQRYIVDAVRMQNENLRLQQALLQDASRPSAKLRPAIGVAPSGKWIAVAPGTGDPRLGPLVGIGDTPEAALESFDKSFAGQSLLQQFGPPATPPAKAAPFDSAAPANPPAMPSKRKRTKKTKTDETKS